MDFTAVTGKNRHYQGEAVRLGCHSQGPGTDRRPTENKPGRSKSLVPSPGTQAPLAPRRAEPSREPADEGGFQGPSPSNKRWSLQGGLGVER